MKVVIGKCLLENVFPVIQQPDIMSIFSKISRKNGV